MKRLINWIAGVLAGVVAYRFWKQRQNPAPAPPAATPETDDRAEELRAKLAETRAGAEPEAAEPTEPPDSSADALEERRRRVHEEGRAAIDEMRGE